MAGTWPRAASRSNRTMSLSSSAAGIAWKSSGNKKDAYRKGEAEIPEGEIYTVRSYYGISMNKASFHLLICAAIVLLSVLFSFAVIVNWSKNNPLGLSIVLIITSMILSYSLGSFVRVAHYHISHTRGERLNDKVAEALNLISIYSLFTVIFIIVGLHYTNFGTIIHGTISSKELNELLTGIGADKLVSLVVLMVMYWMLDEMKKNINNYISGFKVGEGVLDFKDSLISVLIFFLVLVIIAAYTIIVIA